MSILAELAAYATYRVEQAEKQISLSDIKKMAEDIVRFILFEECCDLHSSLRMKMILLEKIHLILNWQVCL